MLAATLVAHAAQTSATPPLRVRTQAIALKPAPPATMAAAHIAALCAKLPTPCDPPATRAWLGVPAALGNALLIDASRPMLIVRRDDGALRQWDFAGYAHTRRDPAGSAREPLRIYPALYPAPDGQYAIALVSHLRESYSGGGAGFEFADFVALDTTGGTADKAYTSLYAGVPFACRKMVRACFSEREYQSSRHCHEETEGYLTIQFPARAVPSDWSFTWHEALWPAHVTRAHTRRTQTRFTLPAADKNALPKNVSFCGGPQ